MTASPPFLWKEDFWDAQYNIMEKLEPKETFNREKDEEVMDKVLKKYRDVNIKVLYSRYF